MGAWDLAEKVILVAAAFLAIVFFYTLFKIWSEGKLHYFLFVEDYQSAAIVFGIVFVIGYLFKKFWKWEISALFGRAKNGGRR